MPFPRYYRRMSYLLVRFGLGGGGGRFRSLCSLAHLACRKLYCTMYVLLRTCRCCWVRKKAENNRVAILLMANKDGKSDPLTPKRCVAPENSRRPPLRFCQRARKKNPKSSRFPPPNGWTGGPFGRSAIFRRPQALRPTRYVMTCPPSRPLSFVAILYHHVNPVAMIYKQENASSRVGSMKKDLTGCTAPASYKDSRKCPCHQLDEPGHRCHYRFLIFLGWFFWCWEWTCCLPYPDTTRQRATKSYPKRVFHSRCTSTGTLLFPNPLINSTKIVPFAPPLDIQPSFFF